ncbi:MAG: type II secretion system F family protein [Planctomycetes bacterium]|nr:type II secretion system F family protein [Planctomycetota bacterium]
MRVAYVALDEHGREVKGGLDAPDLPQAAATLRGQGLFPLELGEASTARAAAPTGAGWRPSFVRTSDLVLFLSELGLMLRTGLSLLQALETLSQVLGSTALRRCAGRLSTAVQSGRTLSSALEDERRLFPPVVVHLVRMAEATGELDQAFARAAEYLERRAALRNQVISSLLYPAVVILVSAGVFWFLTTNVVPKFARFLERRQGALPWTTQLLMDISGWIQAWGPTLLVGLAGALLALLAARATARGRAALDRAVLSIPLVGLVARTAAMSHLGRTLGLLLRSGLPLHESLTILAGSFQNTSYQAHVAAARERVVRGASLAESLRGPLVSPLCTQVVGVGESTGALDEVLDELGTFYDRRLQALLRTFSSLIEPAILLVVGGMVGFVYLSFFQAIFRLAAR